MHTTPPLNPHLLLIKQQLPYWSRHATEENWRALGQALTPAQVFADNLAPWFANAAPDLREAVLVSSARLDAAQQALAPALKGLKQIAEFAEPLLTDRLLSDHQLDAPVHTSELIRVRHLYTWQTYVSQHERHSLLEAALQNFADDISFSPDSALALAGDIQVSKTQVIGKAPLGDNDTLVDYAMDSEVYAVKALPLTPDEFARTCRDLDIGQRYQQHLTTLYARTEVAPLAMTMYRAQLQLDADLAFLRHHLDGAAMDALLVLAEGPGTLPCQQLSLFGLTLHEAVIIDTGTAGLLLHLPGHTAALRQFPDLNQLHQQLCQDLLDPTSRQRVSSYLAHDLRPAFLSRLQQNLDATGVTPTDQHWPLRKGADLHLELLAIDAPLFSFHHDQQVARLKAEARVLAVPTADADEKARRRRLEHWESAGFNTLMVAGLFVPQIGALMLAVTAYQVLDEVFEGYEAWSIGDRDQALAHVRNVGINLALIAGLHVFGKGIGKLASSPLMEELEPITRTDGSQRLWRPELTPYRSTQVLPKTLEPNAQGQLIHQGRYFIHLDGALYEQQLDATLQRWRIIHPDQPNAYQPLLEHNGDGAWRLQVEEPQRWDEDQLLRRLGPHLGQLDDTTLREAMAISGASRAQLQAIYLSGEATPPLLLDSLERLALARRLPDLTGPTLEHEYAGTAPNAGEQRLCADFPRLTTPLARRLLGRLAPEELAAWSDQGTLPTWLRVQAEQVNADLPLVRALEGLYLPQFANADSDRLLFACLERLPDWPTGLRLELRGARPDGPLLATAGDTQAQTQRIVLKSGDGYVFYRADLSVAGRQAADPLPAIVDALPNWPGGEGVEALRSQLQAEAESNRQAWPRTLWGLKSHAFSSTPGLRGGAPLEPLAPPSPFRTSLAARLRRLYPYISDEQIEDTLANWRRRMISPEAEIGAREQALQSQREQLNAWAYGVPRRARAVQRVINAWREVPSVQLENGERVQGLDLSNLELENEDLSTLAQLNDLPSVRRLVLDGNGGLSECPDAFFARFAELESLRLSDCRFDRLPQLDEPQTLQWLDMDGNRITWDDNAQATLERFRDLRILDLSNNPLLRSPNFSPPAVPQLRALFMRSCSLTELPQGLADIRAPLALDLSDNQFTHLPADLVLPTVNAQAMRLESDWLSSRVTEQIEDYHRRFGVDLLIDDADYDELLEEATPEQIGLWQQLPLPYRRALRELPNDERFLTNPQQARAAFWPRIDLFVNDPVFRELALSQPAEDLFELPF